MRVTHNDVGGMSPQAAEAVRQRRGFHVPKPVAKLLVQKPFIAPMRTYFGRKDEKREEAIIEKHNLTINTLDVEGVRVIEIIPPTINPEYKDRILFNIHGGGFVAGSARDRSGLNIAHEMGIKVYSVEYGLAPQEVYPTPLNQCFTVYKYLIKNHDPKNIATHSISAGGSFMMAVLHLARKENLPFPSSIGLHTPATDITGVGDSSVNGYGRDFLDIRFALPLAYLYVGKDSPKNPLISSYYGDIDSTYPPTIISIGTRDCLASNGIRLYWKLREANVPAEIRIDEGMWHGYQMEADIPESIRIRKDFIAFYDKYFV